MTRNYLDELIVPAPPYRMSRPMAILTGVGDGDVAPVHPAEERTITPPSVEKPEPTQLELLFSKADDVEALANGVRSQPELAAEVADADTAVANARAYKGTPAKAGPAPVAATPKPVSPAPAPAAEKPAVEGPLDLGVFNPTSKANYEKKMAGGGLSPEDVKVIRGQMEFNAAKKQKEDEAAKLKAAAPVAPPAGTPPAAAAGGTLPELTPAGSPVLDVAENLPVLDQSTETPALAEIGAPAVSTAIETEPAATPAPAETLPSREAAPATLPKPPTDEEIEWLRSGAHAALGTPERAVAQDKLQDALNVTRARRMEDMSEKADLRREYANIQSEQRHMEKVAADAKKEGNSAKEQLAQRGFVELGQQAAQLREKAYPGLNDVMVKKMELDYAQKSAVVEDYERGRQALKEQAEAKKMDEAHEAALKQNIVEDAHAEALKEEGERKIPRPDRMNVRSYLTEAWKYVVEKTGVKPWLDTMAAREAAMMSRDEVWVNAAYQARAQRKMETAQSKAAEYAEKIKNGGVFSRMWNANRMRKWGERASNLEAKVDKWNGRREHFVEQHNNFLREIEARYNLELQPYKELTRGLSTRVEAQLKARDTLAKHRDETLQKLAEAEDKKGAFFLTPRARAAADKIRDQVNGIERQIRTVDAATNKLRNTLSDAQGQVDKWELKMRTVQRDMKFPEFEHLKRVKRGAAPEVVAPRNIETTVEPRVVESAPTTPEGNPEQRIWKPDQFVEAWNNLGSEGRIEDPKAFAEYIAHERARLRQQGEPTAKQILDLAEPYVTRASRVNIKPAQFNRARQIFLDTATPPKP